jgi:ATP-dependent helicase/nuclease subunit B
MRILRLDAERYWPAVAAHVFGHASVADTGRDWSRILVVVPTASLSQAFVRPFAALGAGSGPFLPPRVATLSTLLDETDSGHDATAGVARLWAVYQQLRRTEELKRWFGSRPAQWLAAARELVAVADQWLLAQAAGAPQSSLAEAVERRLGQRGWRAARPEAALVEAVAGVLVQLPGGPAAAVAGIAHLEQSATWSRAALRLVVLDREPRDSHDRLLLAHCEASPLDCEVALPEVAALLAARPYVANAWHELAEPEQPGQAAVSPVPPPQLVWLPCAGLEPAAQQAARHVGALLGRDPQARIALVTVDRNLARRVRALLERAAVAVVDETGWKLSTTAASTAVMRFLECLAQERIAHLLDWLQSPFVVLDWADEGGKQAVLERLADAAREAGLARGFGALRAALAMRPGLPARRAMQLLDRLIAVRETARDAFDPAVVLDWLKAFGVERQLRLDAAGAQVLSVVWASARALKGGRIGLGLWRSLLSAELEEANFRDTAVQSPVAMLPLASTRLRDFDCAIVLGADERQLPLRGAPALFFTDAVRADLQLPTAADADREGLENLALLVARVPQVVVVWQDRERDEPVALSPWLQRLALALGAAGRAGALPAPPTVEVAPAPAHRARPIAVYRPERWSAKRYQYLIECPYRFYVESVLGLSQLDEATEEPEKRQSGLALHQALFEFHRDEPPGEEAVPAAARLAGLIERAFAPIVAVNTAYLAARAEAAAMVPHYVALWHGQRGEGWRWQSGETELRVTLDAHGEPAMLQGRIDRIDGSAANPRVIDYKTSSATSLKQRLKHAGEDAQLPFYGLLLQQPGSEPVERQAGYIALDRRQVEWIPDTDFEETLPAFEARFLAHAARLREGAPLPAHGSDSVCRWCSARGLCRKGHWVEGEDS